LWDGKGYYNVHAHTTGTGKRLHNKGVYYRSKAACRRERRTANSYRWWCFGYRHRQSCDIARLQGNCVALRLPLHNCGAMVPTNLLPAGCNVGIFVVISRIYVVRIYVGLYI
jgi:hypothetical protein